MTQNLEKYQPLTMVETIISNIVSGQNNDLLSVKTVTFMILASSVPEIKKLITSFLPKVFKNLTEYLHKLYELFCKIIKYVFNLKNKKTEKLTSSVIDVINFNIKPSSTVTLIAISDQFFTEFINYILQNGNFDQKITACEVISYNEINETIVLSNITFTLKADINIDCCINSAITYKKSNSLYKLINNIVDIKKNTIIDLARYWETVYTDNITGINHILASKLNSIELISSLDCIKFIFGTYIYDIMIKTIKLICNFCKPEQPIQFLYNTRGDTRNVNFVICKKYYTVDGDKIIDIMGKDLSIVSFDKTHIFNNIFAFKCGYADGMLNFINLILRQHIIYDYYNEISYVEVKETGEIYLYKNKNNDLKNTNCVSIISYINNNMDKIIDISPNSEFHEKTGNEIYVSLKSNDTNGNLDKYFKPALESAILQKSSNGCKKPIKIYSLTVKTIKKVTIIPNPSYKKDNDAPETIEKIEEVKEVECKFKSECSRSLNTMFFKENEHKTIKQLIDNYHNKEYYAKLEENHRFGICLSGPPGTGKSALMSVLAYEFQLDMYCIDMSRIKYIDDFNMCSDYIYVKMGGGFTVFEDVDAATNILDERGDNDIVGTDGEMNLSCFLNWAQGPNTPNGLAYGISTNHVEKLDEAVTRPGRVDLSLDLGLCNRYQLNNMYKFIYSISYIGNHVNDIPQNLLEMYKENKTTSKIMTYLKNNRFKNNGIIDEKTMTEIDEIDKPEKLQL
jgi:hypothetical protein